MARQRTDGGVTFGNWKLIPMDLNNWELAHLHAVQRGDGKGNVQWNRIGKYYQEDTIPSAIRYALDCELKERHKENEVTFKEFIREYKELSEKLVAEVREAVKGRMST